MNQRPSGYEPDELPGCSTPQSGAFGIGGAGGSRTHNPQIRSLMLYPVELQPQNRKRCVVYHIRPPSRKGVSENSCSYRLQWIIFPCSSKCQTILRTAPSGIRKLPFAQVTPATGFGSKVIPPVIIVNNRPFGERHQKPAGRADTCLQLVGVSLLQMSKVILQLKQTRTYARRASESTPVWSSARVVRFNARPHPRGTSRQRENVRREPNRTARRARS